MNGGTTKRKGEDSSESSVKKIKLEIPVEFHEIHMQQIHRMMFPPNANNGTPFTMPLNNQLFTCCVWLDNSESDISEVKHAFNVSKQHPNLYLPLDHIHVDKNLSATFFNRGVYHFPVQKYVETMYVPSTGYAPLNMLNKSQGPDTCKHSMLSLVQLFDSTAEWLEKAKETEDCFMWTINSSSRCAKILYESLYRINGNLNFGGACDLQLVPVKFDRAAVRWKTRDERRVLCNHVLREFGKIIFRLESTLFRITDKGTPIPFAGGTFEAMSKLFKLILVETPHEMPQDTLERAQEMCGEIRQWFQDRKFWPEICWNQDNEKMMSFIPQRCLELWCYDTDSVKEFEENIKLSGSDWILGNQGREYDQNELFKIKPVLIVMSYHASNGLRCKIVLNTPALFRPLHKEVQSFIEVSDKAALKTKEKFCEHFPIAFSAFVKKLQTLHTRCYLPAKIILERTYTRREAFRDGEFCIDICLYGPTTNCQIRYVDSYPYIHVSNKETYPPSINLLIEACHSREEDPEKHNMWELMILLLFSYKELLHGKKPTCHLMSYIMEFISNPLQKRLYLTHYKGYAPFYTLIALMSTRNPKLRPDAKTLINHPVFQTWVAGGDLVRAFKDLKKEEAYNIQSQEEIEQFDLLSDQIESSLLTSSPIIIKNEWKTEDKSSSWANIIKAFTTVLQQPLLGKIVRNRFPLNVKFQSENVQDIGIGEGVAQEALTTYWKAAHRLKLFEPEESRNTKIHKVKPLHWKTLGILLNHCVLHNYIFRVYKPLYFWKWVDNGPACELDILDMADHDREMCLQLTELLFMTPKELELLEMDYESIGYDWLSGPVNSKNVQHFVLCKIKFMLLSGYNLRFLEALHEGYKVTVPEVRPSPRRLKIIFSPSEDTITANQIIKLMTVTEDSYGDHSKRCLEKTIGGGKKHVCGYFEEATSCPFSCLVNYLKACTADQLKLFLQYVTGSSVLNTAGIKTRIYISMQKSNPVKLPEARTCSKLLILFDNEIDHTIEEAQKVFNQRIEYGVNNCVAFGIR